MEFAWIGILLFVGKFISSQAIANYSSVPKVYVTSSIVTFGFFADSEFSMNAEFVFGQF